MEPDPRTGPTEALIATVRRRAGADAEPLALVAAAVETAAESGRAADRCVDHFVAAARAADLSWTAIGEALGVTKQAARQRFAARVGAPDSAGATLPGGAPPPTDPFNDPARARPAPTLATCLAEARRAAAAQHSVLGTQHLLLGLLTVGTAAAVLDAAGVTRERIAAASERLFPLPGTALDGTAPDGAAPDRPDDPHAPAPTRTVGDGAGQEALERAARMTVQRGHLEIRTELLLFVLAVDPGFASARVLAAAGVTAARVKRELDCRLGDIPRPRRPRRPARRQCAFCGTRLANRPMVAGPGVWICAECVAVASGLLADDPQTGVRP